MSQGILNPYSGAVEHFSLADVREKLSLMPDIDGEWLNPASLTRLGHEVMPYKMLKRFEAKIEPFNMGHTPDVDSVWHEFGPSECWLWTGGLHDKGYGRFYLGKDPETERGVWSYTHRIAFEHWVGKPKPGYIVDHECEVKTCCRPTHLWPQSNIENLRLADLRRPWKRRNQYSKE